MQAFIRDRAGDFAPALRIEYERGLDPTLIMTAGPSGGAAAVAGASNPEKIDVAGWNKDTFVEFFTAKLQGGSKPAVAATAATN